MPWCAYILQCSDNSFYVGHTHNVEERVALHNAGKGATYTSRHRPVTLVYTEAFPSKVQAITREKQLKKWSRAKKRALIEGERAQLHLLAKRHSL